MGLLVEVEGGVGSGVGTAGRRKDEGVAGVIVGILLFEKKRKGRQRKRISFRFQKVKCSIFAGLGLFPGAAAAAGGVTYLLDIFAAEQELKKAAADDLLGKGCGYETSAHKAQNPAGSRCRSRSS